MKISDVPIINFEDAEQVARIMRHIASLKGVYRIEITRVRDQRSSAQNAYYWGVVLPYAAKGVRDCFGEAERGFSSYDAHEFFKNRFLSRAVGVNTETGESLGWVEESTADLSTTEFNDYLANVCQFALDFLGVRVPVPNKNYKLERGQDDRKLLSDQTAVSRQNEAEPLPTSTKQITKR